MSIENYVFNEYAMCERLYRKGIADDRSTEYMMDIVKRKNIYFSIIEECGLENELEEYLKKDGNQA